MSQTMSAADPVLGGAVPVGFIAVSDFALARAFYQGVLGLDFVSEDPYALVLRSGPIVLRLAIPPNRVIADYAVFGWAVRDIAASVTTLAAQGVVFERYDFFGDAQDAAGIWTAPGGARIAWFRDPDGNLLSLSE